jgi:hypothetical protein
MKRRDFVLLLAGAMTTARPLRAQQKAMPVIGYLSVFSPSENLGDLVRDPTRQGMSEMGFVEGQNMVGIPRGRFNYDRLPTLAADLVSRKVDVIITRGGSASALALKTQPRQSRSSSPASATPVAGGLAASLARPGGNLTGLSGVGRELNSNLGSTRLSNIEPLKTLTALRTLSLQAFHAYTVSPPFPNPDAASGFGRNNGTFEDRIQREIKGEIRGDFVLDWTFGNRPSLPVINIEPLSALTEPQTLDISGRKIANIEPLKTLTALQTLKMRGTTARHVQTAGFFETRFFGRI